MRRFPLFLGVVGLVGATTLPAASQQKMVTLFGKTYNVDCQSRAQTYKNGLKVVLPESGNKKANLFFAEGADPSQDRLFVVAPINPDEAVTGHQFYLLTGADANGAFSPTSANLTEFWGGNQNLNRGGRPDAVMLISDMNTGVKVDRNLAMHSLAGDDNYRYYDLDSLSADYISDALFSRIDRQTNADEADPKAPFGALLGFALGPNGTVVTFGRADGGSGVAVGVADPKQDEYFNVLTNLADVTSSSTAPFPEGVHVTGAIRYAENEYWILVPTGAPDSDNDDTESDRIYRLRLTFPPDLAKGTPGSVKVDVLGSQELIGTPLHTTPGGVFGMAVGREVAPGLRRLYFADWGGNLCVATPVP